ncbi:MAG: 50S ribosomal protein L4 [Verrucomicrobia bacterium]|nr:50S ribosomal protein L4 [Verrucomicrobiota bacterium]
MSTLTVYNLKGASVGEMEVRDGVLVTDRGEQAVLDMVLAHLAAKRGGNANTKRKGEVAGSNKKPWKQKGTGRARAGYRQSPVWRGGGTAFGPHKRDYDFKVNRKVGQLALRRAVGDRVAEGALKVVDGLSVSEGRTKEFVALMKSLAVKAPALFVVDRIDPSVKLASRNLPGVALVPAHDLHVYDVVRYPTLVISRAGMLILEKRLGAGVKGTA